MIRSRYALVAFVVTAACGPDAGEFTRAKLMQAVQTSPNRLDLRTYVAGDWERVCFFLGPMPAAAIQTQLGFAWPGANTSGIENSREESLAVFTRDERVVHSVLLERIRGDFNTVSPAYCLSRDSAVFRVSNPEATEYRALVPANP